jgi:threonine dehydrogenase-like Zn-dependent dehydrogenase
MVAHRQVLFFTRPGSVEVHTEPLPAPGAGEVRVKTLISAISSGTEMLIYRGQAPADLPLDDTIAALSGGIEFPLQYGYALVGRVDRLGEGVEPVWQDRLVFAFHPHADNFNAPLADLFPLPEGITPADAVFLPNVETAVNFLMDGAPLIGEKVIVFGQGIVGLLTTALLSRFPLDCLVTLDRYAIRRRVALALGAHVSLDPTTPDALEQVRSALEAHELYGGADLLFELSGSPAALDQAIAAAGFGGRIVIGSWYGQKRAHLNLGGRFHRARLHLVSSQVSSLSPHLSGRWDKARRLQTAWEMLALIRPSAWITHRIPFADAHLAYELLDNRPEEAIQVIFIY